MASRKLIEAVAVTAELCGRQYTPAAAKAFIMDLEGFPEDAVIKSLRRCRMEVSGFLTVADVIKRIDDGRPGPEEAWSMVPKDESGSVVWTQKMAEAFGVARSLIDIGDLVAARMAFLEHYRAAVAASRDRREKPVWTPSLGYDASQREGALKEAVRHGRITFDHASNLCPALTEAAPEVNELLQMKSLTA